MKTQTAMIKIEEKKPALVGGRCSHPGQHLHNGRVAWEMPPRTGALYLCAAYLPAEGWAAIDGLGSEWEEHEGGYLLRK